MISDAWSRSSPVLFVFFNRPETAARVFARIRDARPKTLILASDGPRPGIDGEAALIDGLRRDIESRIDWDCDVTRDYAAENIGCGRRLSTAIETVLGRQGRAIILEDDCVPASTFFPYCDTLLDRFEANADIVSISGTNLQGRCSRPGIGLTHFAQIWGWATWARAWEGYDRELKGWDPGFLDDIAREGIIPSFMPESWKDVFKWVSKNSLSTWDVQFWLLALKKRGLTVFPYRNQISNIGAGSGATHTLSGRFCKLATHPLETLSGEARIDSGYEQFLQYEFYSNRTTWRNASWKAAHKLRCLASKLHAG